jgi:hypothetical protein
VVKEGQQYILLNSDGTWSNVTDGGFAVASDGTRIRLDADGKWHFVASLPVARADAQTLPATGERSSNSLVLVKVEVLKKQRKRAKSTHTDTRTVFHLSVLNVSGKALNSDQQLAAKISVQTSTGRNLEVESISFVPTTIEPGVSGQVRVVADGSPRWFGVKRLELLMAPHALGNIQQQRLAIDMADVEFKFVDNF